LTANKELILHNARLSENFPHKKIRNLVSWSGYECGEKHCR